MGPIDLDMDERRLATKILERAYQDLRAEIHKTDAHTMKDELKREEATLATILKKLGVEKQRAAAR